MKKHISTLVVFAIFLSIWLIQPDAAAFALDSVWEKEEYTDVFGDPTGEWYLTNSELFSGTFKNAAVDGAPLSAKILVDLSSVSIVLYEYGTSRVKNAFSRDEVYIVSIKTASGEIWKAAGTLPSGSDRIVIDSDYMDTFLQSIYGQGTVSFYLERADQPLDSYLFKAECGNFEMLFKEELYQLGLQDLRDGNLDEAALIFVYINDYKDSNDQLGAVLEAHYAREYAATEALLEAGKYLEAVAAFEALGDYRDSAARADEIKEIIYAPISTEVSKMLSAQVGDTVTFGSYEQGNDSSNGAEDIEWLVLAKENNRILVISRYALDCLPFNTNRTSVTWETCTLRNWLNTKFVDAAFSAAEQAIIPTVTVNADKTPYEDTPPGNDTTDRVFLLSAIEAQRYLGKVNAWLCVPTSYAIINGASTSENYKADGKATCLWWLRSPGYRSNCAVRVLDSGNMHATGYYVDVSFAVRPALWIALP